MKSEQFADFIDLTDENLEEVNVQGAWGGFGSCFDFGSCGSCEDFGFGSCGSCGFGFGFCFNFNLFGSCGSCGFGFGSCGSCGFGGFGI